MKGWALIAPALLFIAAFLFVPVASVVGLSFGENEFTLARYNEVVGSALYLKVLWNTVKLALIVTALTALLAYPVAFVIAFDRGWLPGALLVIVGISFWVSFVIRTYVWMVILGTDGPATQLLRVLGWSNPPQLLFTNFAAVIGLTHILLPFMVLALYARMRRIDWSLVTVAESLGAKPWRAFLHVFLPLTLPGLVNGSVLVFVLVLGFYITPALIGSPNEIVLGQLIVLNVEQLLDWGAASAQAVVLMLTAFLIVGVFRWIVPEIDT